MAESAAINKSLTVLGQVVHALNTNAVRNPLKFPLLLLTLEYKYKSRIPYRDSKLTRILQDALGGSSIGLLICNLAPGMKLRQDTINTLKFVFMLCPEYSVTKFTQLRVAYQTNREQTSCERERHAFFLYRPLYMHSIYL